MKHACLASLLAALLVSCAPAPARIAVQLVTDYTPGESFDRIRVRYDGRDELLEVSRDRSFGRAQRIVEIERTSTEPVTVLLALMRGGAVVQEQPRRVRPEAGRTLPVTFLVTRDCEAVSCPGAAAADAIACVGGVCVNPECSPEHPELCRATMCEGGCTASAVRCVTSVCRPEGVCFDEAHDEECGDGLICSPQVGCVAIPVDGDGGTFDAGADAGADVGVDGGTDTGADAGTLPSSGLVVTNTSASGPGSLQRAITTLNTDCASLAETSRTITFDIPDADPGRVARGPHAWWSILGLTTTSITCPLSTVDGTTQGTLHGETNGAVFAAVSVGAAAVPLPAFDAPEIELRGIILVVDADDVTFRGFAAAALHIAHGARVTLEGCLIGSEPDAPVAIPLALRPSPPHVFYGVDAPDLVVRNNVWVESSSGAGSNGFFISTGSDRAIVEDNYFTGDGPGSGVQDEMYMFPAVDFRVLHNYIGGLGWEYHIEWVSGFGGIVSENTFVGPGMTISMGGAPIMDGNVTIP